MVKSKKDLSNKTEQSNFESGDAASDRNGHQQNRQPKVRSQKAKHFKPRVGLGWLGKLGADLDAKLPDQITQPLKNLKDRWLDSSGQLKPIKIPYLSLLFWGSLVLIGTGTRFAYVGWQNMKRKLPDTDVVLTYVRDGTVTIKAADGSTILQQTGPATRDELQIQQIPPSLVNAFIASEDHRFYKHRGVDYQGIGRAIVSNLQARNVVEGGSTITQQLARIVFLDQERTVGRKIREAMLAQKLEQEISKPKILERYLNLVYLGAGAYGVADASWVYFGKPVSDLSLAEAATIAGLAPAPSVYSPLVKPKLAKQRRDQVLQRMVETGFITSAQAREAADEPLKLNPKLPKRLLIEAPYFTSYIQQELLGLVPEETLELSGLTIETTLDTKWQKHAERVVKDAIRLDGPSNGFQQAALVSIDPRNGEIKAMVGGDDFKKSQFNRATQAQRQPGSTFKAFVYATAIEAGFSPYNSYLDAPYRVDGYEPTNANRKHSGWISIRDALTHSVNVVAVKVLIDVGFDPVIDLTKRMGIDSKLIPAYSMALGTSEVNLLEITSAYGTFAAKGKHFKPHGIRRVIDRHGKVLFDASKLKSDQVLDEATASIMTWMLESVVETGTGSSARLNRPVAGKTGTTEEARDLWFIGYIPQLVTGVWLGNDSNEPTWGASSIAAYTWNQFMNQAVKGMAVEEFPKLPDLANWKGRIKPKPVKSARVTTGTVKPEDLPAKPANSSKPASQDSNPSKKPDDDIPPSEPAVDPATPAPTNGNPPPVDPPPGGGDVPLPPEQPISPPEQPPVDTPPPVDVPPPPGPSTPFPEPSLPSP